MDRDGVINVDFGYVHTPDNFEFIEGIFELVLAANRAGYLVIIVTNQAGISRGYYTIDTFNDLTEWMTVQEWMKNFMRTDERKQTRMLKSPAMIH